MRKARREKGFCQIILSSKKSFTDLKFLFEEFINENKNIIDEDLLQGAFELFNFCTE